MQVDPEMNFSGSESSDFEDVYQVKDDGAMTASALAADRGTGADPEDPERNLTALTET